jgi:hypothetical protein
MVATIRISVPASAGGGPEVAVLFFVAAVLERAD